MWDKIQQGKQLLEMRKQAMQIQKQLDSESVEVEKGGVYVKMTLTQKIIRINSNDKGDDKIVEAINEATQKSQKEAAMKMQGMMGGMDALKGMLGG